MEPKTQTNQFLIKLKTATCRQKLLQFYDLKKSSIGPNFQKNDQVRFLKSKILFLKRNSKNFTKNSRYPVIIKFGIYINLFFHTRYYRICY